MARFVVGEPIRTPEPTIVVDGGLRPGQHRFQLVVTTQDGRVSAPDIEVVTIGEPRPIPIDRPS